MSMPPTKYSQLLSELKILRGEYELKDEDEDGEGEGTADNNN